MLLGQKSSQLIAKQQAVSSHCFVQALPLTLSRASVFRSVPSAPYLEQESSRYASALMAVAPASQAAAPPPRAAKKKVKKLVDINGDVMKDLGNGMFQLKLENGVSVMAHLSGKIRQNRIKIVVGDKVTVELSPYDLTRGRITYRFRPGELERMAEAAATAAAAAAAQ